MFNNNQDYFYKGQQREYNRFKNNKIDYKFEELLQELHDEEDIKNQEGVRK